MKKLTNYIYKHYVWLFLLIAFSTTQLYSQTAYNILVQPSTARNIALSGGGTSILTAEPNSNISTINFNKSVFGSGIIFYPADIVGNSAYILNKTKIGIVGLEVFSIDYGTFEDGKTNRTFTVNENLIKGHYKTTAWNSISIGFSLNYLSSKIENYKSNVVSADLGLRTSSIGQRLMLSFSAENFSLVKTSYGQTLEELPERLVLGVSYKPSHLPGVLSVDCQKYTEGDYHFVGAIEFNSNGKFQIRISSGDHKLDLTTSDFWDDLISGVGFGAGLTFASMTIDIGFQNLGPAGYTNAISFKYSF